MMFCINSTRKNGAVTFSGVFFAKERVEEWEVMENDKTDKYSKSCRLSGQAGPRGPGSNIERNYPAQGSESDRGS